MSAQTPVPVAAAASAAPASAPVTVDVKDAAAVAASTKKAAAEKRPAADNNNKGSESESDSADTKRLKPARKKKKRRTKTTRSKRGSRKRRDGESSDSDAPSDDDDADDDDDGDEVGKDGVHAKDKTPGCGFYACGCCLCHKRYPRSKRCPARLCCLNRESKCFCLDCNPSRRTRCALQVTAVWLIVILFVLCVGLALAVKERNADARGAFLLVCVAPVTASDAFFVPLPGTSGPYVQISVWDSRYDHTNLAEEVFGDNARARFSIQLPVTAAVPFLAGMVSPLQSTWRMPSNATVVTDADSGNPLCARGVTLVAVSTSREADVDAAFDGAAPLDEASAETPLTFAVQ